jgi:hypothetical protein
MKFLLFFAIFMIFAAVLNANPVAQPQRYIQGGCQGPPQRPVPVFPGRPVRRFK